MIVSMSECIVWLFGSSLIECRPSALSRLINDIICSLLAEIGDLSIVLAVPIVKASLRCEHRNEHFRSNACHESKQPDMAVAVDVMAEAVPSD